MTGGNLTISGPFTWSGGSISVGGTLTIAAGVNWSIPSGSNTPFLNAILENYGSCTQSGSFAANTAGYILNRSGATYDIRADVDLGNQINNQAGATFKKSGRAGVSKIGYVFANAASTQLTSGTLEFTAGGSDSGSISSSAGTTLRFSRKNFLLPSFTFHNGSSLNAAGTVAITSDSDTVTFNANANVPTLNFSKGFIKGSGNLTVTSNLTWTSGTMSGAGTTTIAPGAGWIINTTTGSPKLLRTLENYGTGEQDGTKDLVVTAPGVIHNHSGGVFNLQSQYIATAGISGTGSFDNQAGAVIKVVSLQFSPSLYCWPTAVRYPRARAGSPSAKARAAARCSWGPRPLHPLRGTSSSRRTPPSAIRGICL